MTNDDPYAALGGGALDQELFRKKPKPEVKSENTHLTVSPTSINVKAAEKSNCQLNAWITTEQDLLITNALYKLKANRVKVKKGELVGIAIEVFSRILENLSPKTLDVSILDAYVQNSAREK